ncbi:SagB family peptide dehydrogenase [Stygiolobus caldivivus]|uniref:Nitroreductase domain-containing protein n=1 Tax=Stygiolobus caldivivus TaxID=2824673 RepID=A0A8D5U4C7_9CREN|nr:SagB family peptide dehydrogenase [Stygiolobus caldivivus]BCU68873.1 hypothetical protein KN1_01700 [Stygiolobus caldivivus]
MDVFEDFYLKTQNFTFTLIPDNHPKVYEGAEVIPLPKPREIKEEFQKVITSRSSTRRFKEEKVDVYTISDLLYYSVGVRKREGEIIYRMFPSAGGLAETEVYIIPFISDLQVGIYHYNPLCHYLEKLNGEFRTLKTNVINSIPDINVVPLLIVLTTKYWKVLAKYGNRGARFVLIDAGIVMENLYLVATALGLGICAVGGHNDYIFNRALDLREGEVVIGVLVAGKKTE